MFKNIKSLLAQRPESDGVELSSAHQNEPLPNNVTPLTPQPLPTMVGAMGDRAQAAIDELSVTLNDWFDADFQKLLASWQHVETSQSNKEARQELFRAAHNLAGMGETYGRPGIGRLCRSLANLLEKKDSSSRKELINLHVEACRAARSVGHNDDSLDVVCNALESEVRKLRAA